MQNFDVRCLRKITLTMCPSGARMTRHMVNIIKHTIIVSLYKVY